MSFLKFKRIREDDEKTAGGDFDDDEMKQLLSGHYIEEVADPFALMSAAEHLELADKKESTAAKQPPSPKVGQKRKQEEPDEKIDVKANILKNCMKI